jgi:6-phosphogluconolactonase
LSAPSISVLADPASLADAAADHFVTQVGAAIDARGTATVALAGGSTPRAMNALLAASPRRELVAWEKVRFFFGDERCVPPEHADSNYRMTNETLFAPLGIAASQIARIHGEDDPAAAAQAYNAQLIDLLGSSPCLDIVFLGMGPDGHTASLFPGTIGALDLTQFVVANFVPKFGSYRITLTPQIINAARYVTITAAGAEKADALAAVISGPHEPERYPAQLVAPSTGQLDWFVDAAAASKLNLPVS